MADNCPFWFGGKCAPPAHDIHDCSFSRPDFDNCAVYKMVDVTRRGGSMEDALRAAGAIPPGARVVGGGGSRYSNPAEELFNEITHRMTAQKKWWQFWK